MGVSSVDLDFHDVGLLLSEVELSDLSVSDNSDDGTVLGDSLDISVEGSISVLLVVLSEGLLLGVHPVLVESSQNILSEVLGPNGS